jgi:hypothetical protein
MYSNSPAICQDMNRYFKSENFLAVIIMLALLNNIEHVSTTYYQLSRKVLPVWQISGVSLDLNALQSIAAILILDFAIIAFVVRGKHKIAGMYAAALFAVQLFYPIDFDSEYSGIATWIATVLFAAMFSYTIYEFSRLYSEESDKRDKKKKQKSSEQLVENTGINQQLASKKASNQIEKLTTAKIENLNQEHTCQVCKRKFASRQALNAHMRVH